MTGTSPSDAIVNEEAMFSKEETRTREQIYEDWLNEIMRKQGCSRGKAKRVIDSMQRKVVKQFRANHFKSTMEKQKRKDLGIPEPAPMTPLEGMLDEVTPDNIHAEVLTGDPVGAEQI